jgi:MFS family permease
MGRLRRLATHFSLVRQREFRLLYVASAASWLGDEFFLLAAAFAAFELSGSASGVGAVFAAEFSAMFAFLLVGGAVADRIGARRVMVAADVARSLTLGVIGILLVSGQAELWHVVVGAAIRGGASGFFEPASTGLVPQVVAGERLHEANALRNMTRSVCLIVGPASAGLVIALSSTGAALIVDAGSFLASALLLAAMRVPAPVREAGESFLRSLAVGWHEFRSRTWVWAGVLQASLFHMLALAPFLTLGVVIAREDLGGPAAWSLVLSAFGAGTLLGGAAVFRLRPRRPLVGALVASTLYLPQMILLAFAAPAPLIAAAALVGGAGFAYWATLWETTLQQHVPLETLSRVAAYDWLGSVAFMPLGYALVGPAAAVLGAALTLSLGAALVLVTVLAVIALPAVRGLRAVPLAAP